MFIPILIGVAVILFLGAFFSKRRFGLLGLALTAGATISTIWDEYATMLVSMTGAFANGPATEAVVLSILVLLPAILLLFHGYTYKSLLPRVVGSLLFALLAVTFLVVPISHTVPLEGVSAEFFKVFMNYKDTIISIGVALAVVDLFFTKPAKAHEKAGKKH